MPKSTSFDRLEGRGRAPFSTGAGAAFGDAGFAFVSDPSSAGST
jgi:hypothetical protein